MSANFQFTVTDTFLIEGRGLILSPYFPLDQFQFNGCEPIRVETADGNSFEAIGDFEIPHIRPTPKVFQAVCVVRNAQKSDIPIGSKVTLVNKTPEQVIAKRANSND